MTLKFLFNDICLSHQSGYGHPEAPARIKSIIRHFNSKNNKLNFEDQDIIKSNTIQEIIKKIHKKELIEKIYQSKFTKQTYFDQDTIANNKTYDATYKASSLAMSAAILSSKKDSYFSIMRPPGHHATPKRAMGFCYFNNIALATQLLLDKNQKVAIIDFDYHYGNGTADIFFDNPNVLYISIHADPIMNYPNQGFIDEIGSKDGKGFNVCIPFSLGSGNNEINYSIQQIVIPLLEEFKPTIIGTSAGFDAYKDDPVGGGFLKYNYDGFKYIGRELYNFTKLNGIPIFHILEGGYNIEHLPHLIYQYASPWLNNHKKDYSEKKDANSLKIKSKEKRTITYVKQMLRPYWNI